MPAKPIWKDYLSAAVRTGVKTVGSFVPGVSEAIEVIEAVEQRREAEARHAETLDQISRVERGVAGIIGWEMRVVLSTLHAPNPRRTP